MKDKLQELKKICGELIAAFERFPESKRDTVLFGEWNVKDSMAHLSGWNLQRIVEIKKFLDRELIEKIHDFDVFNKVEVEKRKGSSWEKLLDEFKLSCKSLIKEFEKIPETSVDKLIWQDSNHTPRKWLQIDINHMKGEHLTQLKKYL